MIASLSTCFFSFPSIPCIWRTSLTNQQLCLKLEGKPMPSTLTITPSSRPFFFFFFPLFPLHWIVKWSTALLRNTVYFLVSIATSIRLMKAGQSFVGKIIMPLTLLSPSSAPTSYCLWWDSVNRVSYTQMAVKLWPWWELQQKETARLEEEAGTCTLLFSGGLPDHYGCCEHPISKASLPWQWQFLPTGRQRKSGKLEETGQGDLFLPMCSLCASSGIPLCLLRGVSTWQHVSNLVQDVPSYRSNWIEFSVFPPLAGPASLISAPADWHPLLQVWVTAPWGPLLWAQSWQHQLSNNPSSERCGMLDPASPKDQEKYNRMTNDHSVNSKTQCRLSRNDLREQTGAKGHGFRAGELISQVLWGEHLQTLLLEPVDSIGSVILILCFP